MLRVAGDTLALTPPLIITEDQIGEIVDKVGKVIRARSRTAHERSEQARVGLHPGLAAAGPQASGQRSRRMRGHRSRVERTLAPRINIGAKVARAWGAHKRDHA